MRLRYSFKVLLIVFSVAAVGIGMFAVRLQRAHRQRDIVAALRAADVSVWYEYETMKGTPVMNVGDPLSPGFEDGFAKVSPWKVWLGKRLGRDFVFDVGQVSAFQPLPAELAAQLPDLRGLGHLELNIQKGFDDEAWRALIGCRQIARLTIKRDQIGPARPLTGLEALDQLQYLTVDGGQIWVDDARAIAGLRELRELTLSLVSVTDESLQPLGELKKLERFSLTHRGTGRNKAAAGVAFVAQLPKLRSLELSRLVSLDDAVFSQLESMIQLESLSLGGGKITGAELGRLKRMPRLIELNLDGTKLDDRAMEKLAELTQLESLSISFTHVTDAGLKHVAGLRNLRKLNVSGNPITNAGMAEISHLPQLEEVMVVNGGVGDAGLKQLESLAKLRALWVSGNPKVTAAGVAALKAALPECNVYDN